MDVIESLDSVRVAEVDNIMTYRMQRFSQNNTISIEELKKILEKLSLVIKSDLEGIKDRLKRKYREKKKL